MPLPAEIRQEIKELLHGELVGFLEDVEWRVKQAYDVERRTGVPGKVYAEDLDLQQHVLTGFTLTANTPGAGQIAWTSLHVVYGGVDYTITDGSTANKYAWFVKPGSYTPGTPMALNTGATKPVLGAGDALLFVNINGVPTNATTASLPVAVADGAVDTGAVADGAITSAKTNFYTALSTAITAAQTAADLAQATADGSITTYFQSAAPWANGTSPGPAKVGDVWYDSDDGQAYRWSGEGGTWVAINDSDMSAALTAANNAQTTANSRITTFFAVAASPPTALAIGDLWIVTDLNNQLRRATATGTGSWTTVQLGTAAIADGAISDVKVGSGINGTKLSSGTVGATQLGVNSVTPTKINILDHILY